MPEDRNPAVTEEISPAGLEKAEEIVDRYEGLTRKLKGLSGWIITAVAVGTSVFYLYAATATLVTQMLRGLFVMLTLFLSMTAFPATKGTRHRIPWYDWVLAFLGFAPIFYMLWDFEEFVYRAAVPETWDVVMGLILIGLVLEAMRRTTGWILSVIVLGFLVYAYAGQHLPAPGTTGDTTSSASWGTCIWPWRGSSAFPSTWPPPLLFSSPSTALFWISPGRASSSSIFPLRPWGESRPGRAGPPSWPPSSWGAGGQRRGHHRDHRLGGLAHAAQGRLRPGVRRRFCVRGRAGRGPLSPGNGAAAFLICEILKISYLEVITMACMPTILYYWSIFLMVEFDAKRFGVKDVTVERKGSLKELTFRYGYHFVSLITIILFMLLGFTAILAVFWSVVIVFALSFIRPESALVPARLIAALRKGTMDVLSVAATCAGAGIIVGIVTLTGLGLQFSSIVIDLARGASSLRFCSPPLPCGSSAWPCRSPGPISSPW